VEVLLAVSDSAELERLTVLTAPHHQRGRLTPHLVYKMQNLRIATACSLDTGTELDMLFLENMTTI
jgi:hypothetical protein